MLDGTISKPAEGPNGKAAPNCPVAKAALRDSMLLGPRYPSCPSLPPFTRLQGRRAKPAILAIELRRLQVGKTREHRGPDKPQMSDGACQFLEPPLAVGDVGRKEILMMAVDRLPFEIFIGAVAEGDGCTRKCVINASSEANLLPLRIAQCRIDRDHDGIDSNTIRLRIALDGTGLEALVLTAGAEKVVCARSQEQLKHLGHPTFEIWTANIAQT